MPPIIFLFPKACQLCPCHHSSQREWSLVFCYIYLRLLFCSKTFLFFFSSLFFPLHCNCVLLSLLIRKYLHLTSCQTIFLYFWYFIVDVTVILQVCHTCQILTGDVQHPSDRCHGYKRTFYQIHLWPLRSLWRNERWVISIATYSWAVLCLSTKIKESFSNLYIS